MVECDLIRQFNMPFDLYLGACNTFQSPIEKVLLCFDVRSGKNRCDRLVYCNVVGFHFILVLMAKHSKLLRQHNVIMTLLLDWPTIMVHH